MSRRFEEVQAKAERLMRMLQGAKSDRGAMADLRCVWSTARRSRAWPWLGRAGLIGDVAAETVAGAFGYHPAETGEGNFGSACRQLAAEHAGAEQRFTRLLRADWKEACELVRPLILALRSAGIPLNYKQLYMDLRMWGEFVKLSWAQSFWAEGPGAGAAEGTES